MEYLFGAPIFFIKFMDKGKHLTTFYRPQRFSELKGQDHIKKVLTHIAKNGSVGKVYLFSGTRGVGKTSAARILAKAINCRQAPTEEPCNRCDICGEITKGISLDVLEIDGASHTGVDNVRKLIEDISLMPVKCKYRVVIIDEVHMLSKSAFNALLKTLEEPPSHAVFILATTEVNKIPSTILSRCQHFSFKKLSTQELVDHLKSILDKESISYDEEAVILIAKRGDGSVRDCLSILSQLVAGSDGYISAELVREVLGIAPAEAKIQILEAVLKKDIRSIVLNIRSLLDRGIDIPYFLEEVTTLFRDLFLIKSCGEALIGEASSHIEIEKMKFFATKFSMAQIHAAWQLLLDARMKLDRAQDPVLFLELLFVNLTYLAELTPVSRVDFADRDFLVDPDETASSLKHNKMESQAGQKNQIAKDVSHPKTGTRTWHGFIKYLKNRAPSQKLPHLQAVNGQLDGEKLIIQCSGYWLQKLKSSQDVFKFFQDSIYEYFGNIEIDFKEIIRNSKNSVTEQVKNDPVIKKVLDEFKGTIYDIKLSKGQKSEEDV
ncbi:hypothetical protein JCM13304A_01270 [Desulfothermus okinawensis JCM 13304]